MGSLSFVMYFSKFIIHQSVLYVILFFQKTCKVVLLLKRASNWFSAFLPDTNHSTLYPANFAESICIFAYCNTLFFANIHVKLYVLPL